jgi:predicted ATPase
MLIHSIKLANLLSFGPESNILNLEPLNIIIGPNSSGKSNFLESFELLRNAPNQLQKTFRESGGISDWLWKGNKETPAATVNVVIEYPKGQNLYYTLSFTVDNQRFEMIDERIEDAKEQGGNAVPNWYYSFDAGNPTVRLPEELLSFDIDTQRSILAQRYDPDRYPEISYLADNLTKIRLYREWSFGQYSPMRIPQKADIPNEYLESDCSNLGLVLNRLRQYPDVKKKILNALQVLYDGIDDFDVHIEGGTVQVFLQEGRYTIPASRLSDGTLRFLSLLAILMDPNPPPLICIEEPELGLHPDILPTLANLLKEASERCQLIVTTHSDVLVDSMTDTPEYVLVCEKDSNGTVLKRLDKDKLKPWLEKYRLGELWSSGEIGGTRW